jgi:DNA-binding NarL/FixJ family response regulator
VPAAIKVAIIEDNADTRAGIAESVRADAELQLIGEYGNAADALAGLARQQPDVMLVDLGLPDMPGLELIRIASERHRDCDILVFTAFGDEAHVLAALEAGAKGYLLKGNLQHHIGLDIRDIKAGGSPLSPVIARHLLRRMEPKAAASRKAGSPDLRAAPNSVPDAASSALSGTPGQAADQSPLSPREREILDAISRGFTYAETAGLLGISMSTVHTHLKHVYRKLAVSSKTEAVFEANRMGLL